MSIREWMAHKCGLSMLLSHFSRVDSVQPHRRQPSRLPRPWDSPGKNTGVACHFLLQCVKVKSESECEVAQLCPTLSDPMDYSLPGSSIRGIFQARGLEWGAIAFSVVYPCNGVLFSHKRGWGTDRCDPIGESWKHYATGKKSDTKCHIWFDSIYMKYPERANRKQIGGFQGLEGGSNRKALVIEYIDTEGGRQFNMVLVLPILCYIARFQMANYDPLVK